MLPRAWLRLLLITLAVATLVIVGAAFALRKLADGRRSWEETDDSLLAVLRGHEGSIESLAFSPNGHLLASGGTDRTIRMWNAANLAAHVELHGHKSEIASLVFSPEGKYLASSDWSGEVLVCDVDSWGRISVLECERGLPISLAISLDSKFLIVGSWREPNRLLFWDFRADKRRCIDCPARERIHAIAIGGERQLVCLSGDDAIRIFDLQAGDELGVIREPRPPSSLVFRSLAVDRGGRIAATRYLHEQTVSLWDIGSCKELGTLKAASGELYGIAFSSDGKLAVTAEGAALALPGGLRFWDMESGQNMASMRPRANRIHCVAYSPTGNMVATGEMGDD